MIKEIVEGLCNTLNTALSKAYYRPAFVEKASTRDVDCSIKVMLGKMDLVGLGEPTKYDHEGWIYFDFGSNEQRAALKVVEAIDELLDWLTANYEKGKGYNIGSYYIRDMEHIPFQGYPQPKEQFYQDMILIKFVWERR